MMKKDLIPYFVWALSLATTLFLSCSREDSSESVPGKQVGLSVSLTGINESDETTEITRGDNNIPSTQTVTVPAGNGMTLEATLERDAQAATRGVTPLAAGVKYRVIAFKQNDVSSSGYISHADYAVGTTGVIAGELHAPSGSIVTFVCYSLGKTTTLPAFNQNSLDVAADPATDDLLYAKFNQTITTESTSISFTLKHQFSLVTVIADASSMSKNISSISCSLSPNYSGTLNLSTGSLTAGTSTARTIPWGTVTAGQTVTATPCTVFTNGSNAITVNITSVTIWYATKSNLTATFGSDVMLPGYKYTLRLNIKKSDVAPISAVGLSWAPGNLIGSLNGDGTFSYSFSPTQEAYSGIWNGGDYWNWCVLDPTNYTGSGSSYSPAVDPCQKVAPVGTWRMPSQTELQNLINSGILWTYRNGVAGRYFGITTVPSIGLENNYVFLPEAGIRGIGSMTIDFGLGFYWSTTADGPSYAYSLGFNSTDGDTYSNYRHNSSTGFSIRCVK